MGWVVSGQTVSGLTPQPALASQAALGRTPSGPAGTSRGTGSEATAPPAPSAASLRLPQPKQDNLGRGRLLMEKYTLGWKRSFICMC